ncbi:MAG TPA: pitrilysin family protein [Azospirillaceae bacterium]|nr:pitrilysin family protein [Azospirillaceae bacterium]
MTVRVTTLPSGLRVATDAMDTVETVSLGVWVGAGTRNEAPEVNGVAHLVEHMLFKGTARRSAFEISQTIEAVGGQLNAHTTREHTAYYAKVLREDAGLALDVIADMVQHSLLDPQELDRERTVILQELGQVDDTPDDIIFDRFAERAFPDQAVGRPVLGRPEIIANVPRDVVADYVRHSYTAPNTVVAAAGRIDHDWLVEQAGRLFTHLPGPNGPLPDQPARYAGGDVREDRDLEQLHLVLGFEGVGYHHPDDYAASVLSTLLGGGMSSRLFHEVREKRGLVYSIYSFVSPYADGGLFGIYAGCDPDQARELVPVVCAEVAKIADEMTEEEVLRAKAQLKAGMLMSLESTMSRAEQLGHQLLAFGRPIPTEEVLARIAAVDRATVAGAARAMLAKPPTVAAIGPLAGLESYERIAERLAP